MKKLFLSLAACVFLLNTGRSQSLDFDGVDDYVSVTNSNYPAGNTHYTLEAWIYPRTMGVKGIIGWGTYGNTDEVIALRLDNSSIVNYWWGDDLSGNTGDISGGWHHVAVTFDGTTRTMYLDGVVLGNDNPTGTLNVTDLTDITIGRTWTGEYFDGQIDEVRVWNEARTANQIMDNMHCSLSSGTNLVASYDFNAGVPNGNNVAVTTLSDITANGNDGTLNGFDLTGSVSGSNWVTNVPGMNPAVTATVTASATTIPTGLTPPVTFSATATNGGATPSYQWYKNNTPVGTNSSTYTDNALADKDTLTCVVTSSIPCATTSTVTSNKIGMTTSNAALNFDGNDDYVSVGNVLTPSYTKEAWVNISNNGLSNNIISGGGDGQHAFWANGGTLQAGHDGNWGTVADNTQLNLGQWYHVAVSYDATAQVMKLYKDGVLISSATGVSGYSGGNMVRLGAFDDASNLFQGNMDEVRIWSTVRTDAEIMDNMNCSLSSATGLVASYNFNDGVPNADNTGLSVLIDGSSNSNDGTLNNFNLIGTSSNWVDEPNMQAAPAVSITSSTTAICAGTMVSFTATVADTGYTPTYQWRKNGNPVGTNSLVYSDNTLSSSDVITMKLTPSIACVLPVISNTISINVTPVPSLTLTGNPSVCTGSTATLTASGATSYTWAPLGLHTATISGPVSASTTLTLTGSTSGCTSSMTIAVNALPNPTITITGPAAVCPGNTAVLTGNGGTSYTWSANASSATTSTVDVSPAVYSVTGSDGTCSSTASYTLGTSPTPTVTISGTTSICSGDNTTLTASGSATSYTWSANASSATTSTVTVNPSSTDTYTVTGDNGTCTSTATLAVTVNSIPTLTVSGTTTICSGNNDVLTASGASTYTWSSNASSATTSTVSVNPSITDTYTVTGDNSGCTSTETITVNVNATPTVAITGTTTICAGANTTLTAAGATNYTWSANAGSAVTSTVTVNPTSTDTYTVTGEDNGCTATETVTVNTIGSPTVNISGTTTICMGDNTTLTASGASSYTWSSNAGSAVTSTVTVNPTSNDTYTVTGDNGCSTTDQTVSILVNSLPSVTFDMNPNMYCVSDPTVTLNATPAGGTFSGTGVNSGVFDPATGVATYTLNYTYTDVNSCTNTDTAVVDVQSCSMAINKNAQQNVSIYPNPGTDVLYVNHADLGENSTLEIYNSLGEKVTSVTLNNSLQQININNLRGGAYEIKILSNNMPVFRSKFIKQ